MSHAEWPFKLHIDDVVAGHRCLIRPALTVFTPPIDPKTGLAQDSYGNRLHPIHFDVSTSANMDYELSSPPSQPHFSFGPLAPGAAPTHNVSVAPRRFAKCVTIERVDIEGTERLDYSAISPTGTVVARYERLRNVGIFEGATLTTTFTLEPRTLWRICGVCVGSGYWCGNERFGCLECNGRKILGARVLSLVNKGASVFLDVDGVWPDVAEGWKTPDEILEETRAAHLAKPVEQRRAEALEAVRDAFRHVPVKP